MNEDITSVAVPCLLNGYKTVPFFWVYPEGYTRNKTTGVIRRILPKQGRNSLCTCGSNLKTKRCCGEA